MNFIRLRSIMMCSRYDCLFHVSSHIAALLDRFINSTHSNTNCFFFVTIYECDSQLLLEANDRRSLSKFYAASDAFSVRAIPFIMNSNAVCIGRREKFICKIMLIELSQKPIRFYLASCLAYVTRCCCSSLLSKVEKNFEQRFVLFHSLFIIFIRRLPFVGREIASVVIFVCQFNRFIYHYYFPTGRARLLLIHSARWAVD